MLTPGSLIRNKPVFKLNQPDDSDKFHSLPAPSGPYPYRLSLSSVLKESANDKLVMHMVGDTGSVRNTDFQKVVVAKMTEQFREADNGEEKPMFLYHLGDIVYNFGEAAEYPRQFFEAYSQYPAPIFAIAGNHDSDVNPLTADPYSSLQAFCSVFCDTEPREIAFCRDHKRVSSVQPNVYWTLESPLVTIIGLHSNVPKYGIITQEQREWFVKELRHAAEFPDKALFVCLHHAPYSADINHGSSYPMIELLEGAFKEAGVIPDMVFSGHVHNYQRLIKSYDEKKVTYIVAGAGGYDELHPIADPADKAFSDQSPFFENILLQNYCFKQHGFLKLSIEKVDMKLQVRGNYYTIPHHTSTESDGKASLFETFDVTIDR
jgi:calcineurin-like phosphoesterase family protein